jgi:uncharacterized protein (DUF2235 family)
MKTIVLCADGTGNSATKGRGTNVFKLFEAVDFNGHLANPFLHVQVGFYDDGVGTQGTFVKRLVGSAGAWGFGANVKQLYAELCRVYAPGDRIFLFGFSRGALTVRHLAGMIGACGVLNGERFRTTREFHDAVSAARGSTPL